MEEIIYENEPKNNNKYHSENEQILSPKTNNVLNIQNIPNMQNIINNKKISFSFDHSKYKRTRLFGINFYHIGNLYVFGFITYNSEPLFCIDNGWYFQIIIYIIEFLIFYFGNKYLYSSLEHWKQICFNILLAIFFLVYTALILINPGIIIKNEQPNEKHNDLILCRKCNIYTLMERNTEHCYDCKVCVRKLDHHCSVVRRCITNRNFWFFVSMIVCFILIYIFSLINLIFYFVGSYRKIKKNKHI